jgi:hypothetical protein
LTLLLSLAAPSMLLTPLVCKFFFISTTSYGWILHTYILICSLLQICGPLRWQYLGREWGWQGEYLLLLCSIPSDYFQGQSTESK